MKLDHIKEPFLEFGQGSSVCPRAGISSYNVYDTRLKIRRERVYIGAVGTSDSILNLVDWIEKCSSRIEPPPNDTKPKLNVAFCGFNKKVGYKAELVIDEEITRSITNTEISGIIKVENWNQRVEQASELFYQSIKFLAQNRVVDVIICVLPNDLYDSIVSAPIAKIEETVEDSKEEEEADKIETNFRRLLKARSLHLGKPIQIVRELTLDSHAKEQQNEATKAWNFCTALYYKANQTVPWRLITNLNKPSTCFVGISFYRSRDGKILNTSLAQIFNELGQNVILRGTPVDIDKNDRRPYLKDEQAYSLLSRALTEYEIAMRHSPGRLVLHKSSRYTDDEIRGFEEAAAEFRIQNVDFITILDSDLRLLRGGEYPVYRGTHVELSKNEHLLYTRGSVEHYETQTSKYIPQPLEIRIAQSDESPSVICQEILGLSKMNWNNTQFDGKYPITLVCARRVGQIMKYLNNEKDEPQVSYSFYM
jgi:hypothetical protein